MTSEEQNYLTHPHVEALTARIHCGEIVPLVGAGFSAPFGYPLWERFLRDAAEHFSETKSLVNHLLDRQQYERATAVLYEATYDRGMIHRIIDNFALIKHKQDEIRNGIEKAKNYDNSVPCVYILPYLFKNLIATTNVDHVLRDIYHTYLGQCPQIVVNTDSELDEIHNAVTPVIFKIHGDAEDDMSRIFSRSEYQHHYLTGIGNAAIDFAKRLPRALSNIFKNKSILFLGSSLYPDRLLEVLRRTRDTSKHMHFAIIEQHEDHNYNNSLAERLHTHGVKPIYYPKGSFEIISKILNKIRSEIDKRIVTAASNSRIPIAVTRSHLWTIICQLQLKDKTSETDLLELLNKHTEAQRQINTDIDKHFPYIANPILSNVRRKFSIKLDANNDLILSAYPEFTDGGSVIIQQNTACNLSWRVDGHRGNTVSIEVTTRGSSIEISFINKDTNARLGIRITVS